MKNKLTLLVMVACILMAGCGKKSETSDGYVLSSASPRPTVERWRKTFISENQVVCYANIDTNNMPNMLITVTEIWKGSNDASALGVSNGMQFPFQWPDQSGALPDGAVVGFRKADDPSIASPLKAIFCVRTNQVLGTTLQNLKKSLGD